MQLLRSPCIARPTGHRRLLSTNGRPGTAFVIEAETDDVPFETRFAALEAKLEAQFAESAGLEAEIRKNLARLRS